jgi:hypothetical protein
VPHAIHEIAGDAWLGAIAEDAAEGLVVDLVHEEVRLASEGRGASSAARERAAPSAVARCVSPSTVRRCRRPPAAVGVRVSVVRRLPSGRAVVGLAVGRALFVVRRRRCSPSAVVAGRIIGRRLEQRARSQGCERFGFALAAIALCRRGATQPT